MSRTPIPRASRLPPRRRRDVPLAPVDDRPPALWRSFLAGVVASAVSSLLAGLLVSIDFATGGVVAAVFCGLAALMVTMREGFVAGFLGLLIVSTAGIVASGAQGYPLFGTTVRGISVAQAPAQTTAAVFHFTDGQVRTDLAEDVGIHDGSVSRYQLTYELVVVPVVPADWSPATPVPVWAVSEKGAYPRSAAAWAQPYQAGVRVVSIDSGEIRTAIGAAERDYGLVSAPDAPIIRWVADPERAVSAQWERLEQITAVCAVAWGMVLSGNRLIGGLRGQGQPRWR